VTGEGADGRPGVDRRDRPGPGRRAARIGLDALAGVGVPVVTAVLLEQAGDPMDYRPGTLLLAGTVAVSVLVGLRAGVIATAVSILLVWWEFTEPRWEATVSSAVSVVVFAASAIAVLVILTALRRARAAAESERRVVEAVFDNAPVGMALMDHDLRFRLVNRRLAELNVLAVEEHLGRTPGEIDPAAGERYGPLLTHVRDTGEALLGQPLSVEVPERGVERHWRLDFYPVPAIGGAAGVGCTVEEVTGDVIARRRSAQLLELAQALAGAVDRDALTDALTGFLAEAFACACAVAYVDGEHLRFTPPTRGYPAEVERLWIGAALPLDLASPLCHAVVRREPVTAADADELARRYPGVRELGPPGDDAVACIPITHPGTEAVQGVIRLAWSHHREFTDTTRTFCETVASMASLALERIELARSLEEDRFRIALDSMLDHVTIGTAVRGVRGELVDIRLDYVSASAVDGVGRAASELRGRSVRALYPSLVRSGQWDLFTRVVETGEPWSASRFHYEEELPDGTVADGYWSIQVVRFGDGFLAAFRDVTEVVRLEKSEREAERARERELVSVHLLQRAALPASLPDVAGVRIGARYLPADTEQPIGGDWYDAFVLPDGGVAVVIADVAGHGPEAAAFMVQVRNILRAVAVEHAEPDVALCRANRAITAFAEPGGPFVTCCYAVLDPASGRFTWASAGHLPPILADTGTPGRATTRDAARALHQTVGLPLAVADDAGYTAHEVELGPGDRVVLYTDGLIERRGERIDVGLERLERLVEAMAEMGPADAADHLGGGVVDPFDDVAVLVVDLATGPDAAERPAEVSAGRSPDDDRAG
jgi:PAS domain-containing protein